MEQLPIITLQLIYFANSIKVKIISNLDKIQQSKLPRVFLPFYKHVLIGQLLNSASSIRFSRMPASKYSTDSNIHIEYVLQLEYRLKMKLIYDQGYIMLLHTHRNLMIFHTRR